MLAAYIDQIGPAADIRLGLLPTPRPAADELMVAVELTPVNRVDTLVRSGAYPTPLPFPFIIGRDVVGTVLEAGSGVDAFGPGDRVWANSLGHDGRQGTTAERVVVAANRAYPLPAGASAVSAAAIAHPAATAHLAVAVHGRVRPGHTVVVTGAAGNVGTATVVLAAGAGARVVAVAAAADHHWCLANGADVVVDYRHPAAARRLRGAAPDGVDVYVDAAGRNDLALAVEVLAERGRVVVLAGPGSRPGLPVGALYTKGASIHGFAISRATTGELAAAAEKVNELLVSGRLAPRQVEILPFSAASCLHQKVEQEGLHGHRYLLSSTLDQSTPYRLESNL